MNSIFYYLMKFIAKVLILFTISYKVIGKEEIPAQRPYLIVANHLSVGDPVLVGATLDIKVIFMAKEDLFRNRIAGYFIRQFGAFPVHRGGSNVDTLRRANEILRQGQVLCMFPEGKRSAGNGLLVGQNGSAMIAYHNAVPILPIGITGSEKIRGYRWIWNRPKVTLKIGQPFNLPVNNYSNKEFLNESTDIIMGHIAELLPDKYRGEYAKS